ncbi:MAG: general secretion pathway protein GspB [Candidatus Competibacteraceae bacterium]
MSYILEALRKAEQERNLGRVPDLQTAPMPIPQPKRRLWPLVLGLVLVANGVALALLWWPDYRSRLVVSDPQLAIPAAEPVVPASRNAIVNSLDRPIANPQTESVSPVAFPAQSVQATLQPLSEPEPAVAPITPPPAPPPAPEPTPARLPESQPAIALQALPMTFRQTVPQLNLDVHVYSTAVRKRFVLINSKRYQEGDLLNEGPLLEAITADGAVLSYQGQRFLLPVYQ